MNSLFDWENIEKKIRELSASGSGINQSKLLPYRDELMRLYPDIQFRPAAVLALLYPFENHIHTVFIRRKIYDGVHSGQIAFPGGKKEAGDQNLWQTALREASEELNIPSKEVKFLRRLTNIAVPVSAYMITPFLGYITHRPEFKPQINEVEEIIEFPFIRLLKQPWKIKKKEFNGNYWPVYYLEVNGHHIWGATAMVIAELRDLFGNMSLFS